MDLDDIDWHLIELLQSDGRLSYSELGRRVSLSASAVTERVRRLEQRGVITGYGASIDTTKLGLPIEAIVRVRVRSLDGPRFRAAVLPLSQVISADHVTGDECWILRVLCQTTAGLEQLVEQIQRYGETTTSLVFSSPLRNRPITRPQPPPDVPDRATRVPDRSVRVPRGSAGVPEGSARGVPQVSET